jgi:hypothetical protein
MASGTKSGVKNWYIIRSKPTMLTIAQAIVLDGITMLLIYNVVHNKSTISKQNDKKGV